MTAAEGFYEKTGWMTRIHPVCDVFSIYSVRKRRSVHEAHSLEGCKNLMSACPCAVDDPSRAHGVADVDQLGVRETVCQSGHLCEDRSICSHAEADEAVVERHLDDLALRGRKYADQRDQ